MNLGDYISSYLDGELTSAEDSQFRAILTEDPLSREEFESAALINVAMMNEADDISVPEDLLFGTEEMILQLMQEEKQKSSAFALRPYTGKRLASATVVLMLFMLFAVQDTTLTPFTGMFEKPVQLSQLQPTDVFESVKNSNHSLVTSGKSDKKLFATTKKQPNALVNQQTSENPLALDSKSIVLVNTTDSTLPFNMYPRIPTFNNNSFSLANSNPMLPTVTTLQPNVSAQLNSPQNIAHVEIPSPYQVSAFFGTVVSQPQTRVLTQHYSQSLGIAVTDGDYLGIEVGSISISTTNASRGFSPNGFTVSGENSQNKGMVEGSTDNGSSGNGNNTSGNSFSNDANKLITKDLVWGAAYFEHRFVTSSSFQLSTRMGVGTSGEGPLVFGRGYAQYQVYKTISLTAGTEGRMFITNNPNHIGGKDEVQTLLSMIYGLQVRF